MDVLAAKEEGALYRVRTDFWQQLPLRCQKMRQLRPMFFGTRARTLPSFVIMLGNGTRSGMVTSSYNWRLDRLPPRHLECHHHSLLLVGRAYDGISQNPEDA